MFENMSMDINTPSINYFSAFFCPNIMDNVYVFLIIAVVLVAIGIFFYVKTKKKDPKDDKEATVVADTIEHHDEDHVKLDS